MIFDFKEKDANINLMNKYLLNKTLSMFEYENLPDSIPAIELEKLLQNNGNCFFTLHEGVHYVFGGSVGGEQDVYGNLQLFTVNNTFLKLNKQYNIVNDGVLIKNDSLEMGLIPLFNKYNTLLAENELSMLVWEYNSRTQSLLSATDDKSKESAESYINKLISGDISVIGTNALFDGITVHSKSSSDVGVTNYIELQQYAKSNLYNEVGLSSNFNMKKERLISAEVDQSEDSIFSLVYNMLQMRQQALALINEKYDLNIEVDFGSVWSFKNDKLTDGVINNEQESNDENRELDIADNSSIEINLESEKELAQEQERVQDSAPEPEPELEPESEQELEPELETELEQESEIELEEEEDDNL